jgi:hypothetical protein
MNIHDATEQAYRNGYEKGYADALGGGWVSVEERLPEVGTDVIGYSEKKDRCFVVAYSDTYKSFFSGQFTNDDITHWMPLPLPPKEGEGK